MTQLRRAYLFIGVKKAKTLPGLEAVWDNVDAMHDWAVRQNAKKDDVVVITDQYERVTLSNIYDAVSKFCERGTIDQLLIYFSGHGVNNARSEFWLLSDAVENPNAAVNVSGSIDIAQYGVIPHVVFVSDACRTAASGIQAQSIAGGSIFPIKGTSAESRAVDVFYGTSIGDESYEVAKVDDSVAEYRAVYTDSLLLALNGHRKEVLKRSEDDKTDFLNPRPLKKFLKSHVPMHLYELGIRNRTQQPDAVITSDDDMYLSMYPVENQTMTTESTGTSSLPEAISIAMEFVKQSDFANDATKRMLDDGRVFSMEVISHDITQAMEDTADGFTAIATDMRKFNDEIGQSSTNVGPDSLPAQRGFVVRGVSIVEVVVASGNAQIRNNGTIIEFATAGPADNNVLLITSSGHGVVLPAFKGFLVYLTFDGDRLLDISFIPDAANSRFHDYTQKKDKIANLRAVIAASSRRGKFEFEGLDEKLARRMQLGKSVDPSLSLYAAHAYRAHGKRERLVEMSRYLKSDLGACLFDVALLASTPHQMFPSHDLSPIAPFAPLLSQSWPILQVREYALPDRLKDISVHALKDSLWTIYTPEGVELIQKSIQNKEIQ